MSTIIMVLRMSGVDRIFLVVIKAMKGRTASRHLTCTAMFGNKQSTTAVRIVEYALALCLSGCWTTQSHVEANTVDTYRTSDQSKQIMMILR